MKSLTEWKRTVGGSIRCTVEQTNDMAIICKDAEANGGLVATWHVSAMYFGHKCNCQACRQYSQAGW